MQQAVALHRAGREAEAERLFAKLQKRAPKNPEILFWRGLMAQERDQPKAAIPLFKRALSMLPKQPEIRQQLALAYQQDGQLDAAERHLRKALELRPNDPDSLLHLGNLFAARGDPHGAAESYRAVLDRDPSDIGALLNLGHSLRQLGRLDEAADCYQQAIEHHPNYCGAHDALGALHHSQGRLREAAACFQAALDIEPKDAAAHYGLAAALRDLGRLEGAIEHFESAAQLAPRSSAYAGLAATLERAHRLEAALEAADKALALDPRQADVRLVQAKVAARRNQETQARELYEALIDDIESGRLPAADATLARCQADLAQLCEAAGEPERAFALFAAANASNCRASPNWLAQAAAYVARVTALTEAIEGLTLPAGAPAALTTASPAPVFLLGFPRSGTTLLDRLLDAHSRVTVMEEKTVLDSLASRLGESDADRLLALSQASWDELEGLRCGYWEQVAGYGLAAPEDGLFMDKLPLNILNVWLIRGLFPHAKIIFGLRDPRDVCLSCFTNLFRLGEGLAGFPSLEHSAELYAAVMTLWLRAKEKWAFDLLEVRYEDLITDLEGEARRLCSFLSLPWEPGLLDYRERAKEGLIVTPSYHQVVRPLYHSSRQRWRRYATEMAPVLPVLAPFVETLGYEP